MIFYRLALQRLIDYFQLFKPSQEDEQRMRLLHKKPKESHKTKLKTDRTLNLYISILLSIISMMICISIPFSALEMPCEIFKQREMPIFDFIFRIMNKYAVLLDIVIILLMITLVYVSVRMVVDAIRNTKINISPWIEMGKYTLPPKNDKHKYHVMGNIKHSSYL